MRTGTAPKRVKTTQNRGCFYVPLMVCGVSVVIRSPACALTLFLRRNRPVSGKWPGRFPPGRQKNKKALRGVPEGRISANGDPGESRTLDLLLRRQSLYPTELRSHVRHPEYAKEGHMSTSAEPQGKNHHQVSFSQCPPRADCPHRCFSFQSVDNSGSVWKKIHALFRVRFQKNFSRGVVNCHYPFFPLIPRRAASAGCSAAAP